MKKRKTTKAPKATAGQTLPVLIFGCLPPSGTPGAALLVHIALALSGECNVTVVIADTAPPPTAFGAPSEITIIRERDLYAKPGPFENHKRLFILGNNAENLFALALYKRFPGLVILSEGHMNGLFQLDMQCSPQWPTNYTTWLTSSLGDAGETIAQAMTLHRRISHGITPEYYADSIDTVKASDQFSLPNALIAQSATSIDRSAIRRQLGLSQTEVVVAATTSATVAKARQSLAALDLNIHLLNLSGAEDDLDQFIACSDVVLVAAEEAICPPMMMHALVQKKPIIAVDQPSLWFLEPGTYIDLPHAKALDHMVAAIGALATDKELCSWYSAMTGTCGDTVKESASAALLTDALKQSEQEPFLGSHPATPFSLLQSADTDSMPSEKSGSKQQLKAGPPRSVALIGAIPPRTLIEQLFPEVDWDTSPRFATAALSDRLCMDAPLRSANKLAQLGYDTPLISTEPEPGQGALHQNSETWRTIETRLIATSEALTFGCHIEGTVSADRVMRTGTGKPFVLQLKFERESDQQLQHYDQSCGLFWQIDPVREQINCTLIAGLKGRYQVNLTTIDLALMFIDERASTALIAGHPATSVTDNQGVLSFTLKALSVSDFSPLNSETLIKSLAECDLNLEWLGHG